MFHVRWLFFFLMQCLCIAWELSIDIDINHVWNWMSVMGSTSDCFVCEDIKSKFCCECNIFAIEEWPGWYTKWAHDVVSQKINPCIFWWYDARRKRSIKKWSFFCIFNI